MSTEQRAKSHSGFFHFLINRTRANRLGDLLVSKNLITKGELQSALNTQKENKKPIGKILIEKHFLKLSSLYLALAEQYSIRAIATAITITITICAVAPSKARANSIRDVPARIKLASISYNSYDNIQDYPRLFNSTEKSSSNITPFTKWSSMFERFEASLNNQKDNGKYIKQWVTNLAKIEKLSIDNKIKSVNRLVNAVPYISDDNNYNKSDLWADPISFFKNGGDCEDYAIAKYASLRALGIPENRMRIAIVQDKIKNIPHAVLIVYTDNKTYVLDNQIKEAMDADTLDRYRPIFSINRMAWWLHTEPATIMASAR